MKSSKLTPYDRRVRREKIMEKRGDMILAHDKRGRSYVQSKTTKFDKTMSDRQRARYARQTGYIAPPIAQAAPTKPKRTRKAATA